MSNTLCANELVGQMLHVARRAAQEHDFKARSMVQVGVKRRNNNLMLVMLKVGWFFRK